jgi:hypothetical protein
MSAFSRAVLVSFLVGIACLATSASSLEKTAVRSEYGGVAWQATSTTTVAYYNDCTGWLWIWGGWEPQAQLGVWFESPRDQALLTETSLYQYAWTYPGYAYSATVDLFAADANGCPDGGPLASQPYIEVDYPWGWVTYPWNVPVPDQFVLTLTFHHWTPPWSPEVYTDHPAAGPTGPAACGHCYPTNRVTRSFIYNDGNNQHCPGIRFNDFVCDAELVWTARFNVGVSVASKSWSRIKSLYR